MLLRGIMHMHNIIKFSTSFGPAFLVPVAEDGMWSSLSFQPGCVDNFRWESSNGFEIWVETTVNGHTKDLGRTAKVRGPSVVRSGEHNGELVLEVLNMLSDGRLQFEYRIPAIHVLAIAPCVDIACREEVLLEQVSRTYH